MCYSLLQGSTKHRIMGYDLQMVTVSPLVVVLLSLILEVFWIMLWRPYVVTKSFRQQGIMGPPYSVLSGSLDEMKKLKKLALQTVLGSNSHDTTQRVAPHYERWSSQYGDTFLYWHGMQPRICISDPELAKHVLSNKSGFYVKPKHRPSAERLAGKGLALANGLEWSKRRKIIIPAFTTNKLKVMAKQMGACTMSMMDEWKIQGFITEEQQGKTMEMHGEFRMLMADIIAHTAFGSRFMEGKGAFKAQIELQKLCAAASANIFFPGSQYLPNASNIQAWKLDRKVKDTIRSIIVSRLKALAAESSDHYGDDLIGVMIGASEMVQTDSGPKLSLDEIVEECKSFFFAGHETTANFITWTVYLLSVHQEWQEKLREEILRECGVGIPNADMLAKLNLVHMVLQESLRLYCPVMRLIREGSDDSKIGNLIIPKDICLEIPLIMIHRSKKYWGEDAKEFNPLRFINGISKAAKHPNALLAFGVGPRVCIAQNFAMLAAKMVIALILGKFSLSLSPDYKHTPVDILVMQPQHGLPIIIKHLC